MEEFYRFEEADRGNGWKPLAEQIDELQRIWIDHIDSHDINTVKECLENAVKVTGVDITQPKHLEPFITLAIQIQVQQRDRANAEMDRVGVLHQGKCAREAETAAKNRKCLMQLLLAWQGTKHRHCLMKNEEKTEATNNAQKVPPPPPYINPNNPSTESSTTNSLYPLLNVEKGQFRW
ncbi:hypothetical protein GOODEAATRI_030261 [Goodea atripinnis]|uniref:Gag protein n=1 Tax=Goodea atripinnis TaxID=208336 RepID=A0ABV0MWE6_9TELE